jgi:hypothetical protein
MDIPESDSSIAGTIEDFETRLRLARAAELGLAGRLLQAESVLSPNGSLPDTSLELDMLARINVRQGRFSDALKRWREARLLSGKRSFESEIRTLLDYATTVNERRKRLLVTISSAWVIVVISLAILYLVHR